MDKKKWLYQIGEDEYWLNERYDTKEEAINACKQEYNSDEDKGRDCFVGRVELYRPFIDAGNIIEEIQEDACDNCGDVSDKFLNDVTEEQMEELHDKLNNVLSDWLTVHNLWANFGNVVDVEEIKIDSLTEE